MILDIYKDSIEYAIQDHMSLLKLGICMLLSFLIIPAFLVMGYEYRVLAISTKGMVNGNDKLPEFDDLIGMFVDGLKMFIVSMIYMIIPIIVLLIFNMTGNGINISSSGIGIGLLTTEFIISLIVFIIFFFMSLMAVTHMVANDGSFKAAFDIKGIWKIISNIGWIRYILFYLGLVIAQGVIIALTIIVGIILQIIFSIGLMVLGPIASSTAMIVITILVSIVYSLLLEPFMSIFRNRALGLIYEPLEE